MHQSTTLKRCAYLAFAAMVVLCIGSIIFYKERMIFTDASLVSFRRINLQDLESSQRRWGAFITEAVPLLLSKMHVPLRALLVSYSLSFNLFYLLVMALLVFRWRLHSLSISMASYYLLFVSAGYFWTNNEIHQAIAYLFLCLGVSHAMIEKRVALAWQYVGFTLLSGLTIFTHPLAIIVTGFLWGALWISGRDWPYSKKQATHFTIILIGWTVVKLLLSVSQAYDARRMHGVTHLTKETLLHAWNGPVARSWYQACLDNYWPSIIVALAGFSLVLAQRKWLLAGWCICCSVGFIVLLHCGFPDGHFLYYLEGEWQIMGIMAAVPIVYYLLPRLKTGWAFTMIAVLFMVRLGIIAQASGPFTKRVAFIESLNDYARRHALNKVLIKASDNRFESRLFMDWGLATESMTLSALAHDNPQITLCALWPDHPERIPEGNKEMVWNFDKRPASKLNAYYFTLDTTHPYVTIPFEEMEKDLR